jgi:hypothetical protein
VVTGNLLPEFFLTCFYNKPIFANHQVQPDPVKPHSRSRVRLSIANPWTWHVTCREGSLGRSRHRGTWVPEGIAPHCPRIIFDHSAESPDRQRADASNPPEIEPREHGCCQTQGGAQTDLFPLESRALFHIGYFPPSFPHWVPRWCREGVFPELIGGPYSPNRKKNNRI